MPRWQLPPLQISLRTCYNFAKSDSVLTVYRKVWDTHTGEALHTLSHNHIVRAVAFPNQPHPQILATGGMEKKLRIYDL